jgi:uncharacterized protein
MRPAPVATLLIVLIAGTSGSCAPERRTFLTIATGGTGGVYYPLGGALAQVYTTHLPGLVASAQATVASIFNVQAVEQGRADLAFTMADAASLAYRQGTATRPHPHTALRTLAVLYPNTVHVVVRADGPVRSVHDLRGRRVGVGAPASGTELVARIVIEAHGLEYGDVRGDFLSFSEVASQLQDRTVDAGFVVASYPVAAIADVATSVGVRLLPIDAGALAQIRADYPFYQPVTIPAGTYRGQNEPVSTIGVDNLLVCRADLDDELVYRLTAILFESLAELAGTHAAARRIDPDRAADSPIPLHPGAARYYRERGLLP